MGKKQQDTNKELIELCVDIYAHVEMDFEITLGGNGTNCCEASNVADAILKILKVKQKDLEDQIKKRVAELKAENGYDEEDEEE